jgi:DNA-binding MarR family transcriptional regulator
MKKRAEQVDLVKCAEIAESCTNFNLRKVSRAVGAVYDVALRPAGLRGTQFNLLVALALHETTTVMRLAKTLATDRTSLTRALAPLERDGLIESCASEDGRERLLSLTRDGARRLSEAVQRWEQAQKRIVEVLGGTGWRQLTTSLKSASALLNG